MIKIFVGYDSREAIAYHVFSQSLLEKSSEPLSITPLSLNTLNSYIEEHKDGSNDFIYSRFLVPNLQGYNGWALFADGDMVCLDDIAKLYDMRDDQYAVMVVKHDYKTKASVKYLGNKNENYPRKNWSSVILWNCGHPANSVLTPELIAKSTGAFLHRFSWLSDDLIGELPKEWNWLADEYPDNRKARLVHFTLGTPCFKDYRDAPMSSYWHQAKDRLMQGIE